MPPHTSCDMHPYLLVDPLLWMEVICEQEYTLFIRNLSQGQTYHRESRADKRPVGRIPCPYEEQQVSQENDRVVAKRGEQSKRETEEKVERRDWREGWLCMDEKGTRSECMEKGVEAVRQQWRDRLRRRRSQGLVLTVPYLQTSNQQIVVPKVP